MSESGEEDVNDFFGFGLFDGDLDEPETEERAVTQKKASKMSVEALMKHLGGFEYWPVLIDDCKEVVAKFLDYKTLTKLGMCSKADNALVDKKIPYHVYSVEILDNESHRYDYSHEEFENVSVRVQFDKDFNSGKRFEMIFSQNGQDTEVQWKQYFKKKRPENRNRLIKNSNYYEEAVKYAEKWMEKGQFKIKAVTVEMLNYPFATSKIKSLPNCTDVRIGADDETTFRWWLEKVPEDLKSIQLLTHCADRDTFTLPSDFLSLPQVMNAKDMYFWGRAAFSDEQFLNLKAKKISFDAVNITDEGVHEFLKMWVNGKAVDDFKNVLLWSKRVPDQSRVMRGLDVRPWDNDFEDEAGGFCGDYNRVCGRGESFQISSRVEPLDSLTLSFADDRISIYATGKKFTWSGRTYTNYSIPM